MVRMQKGRSNPLTLWYVQTGVWSFFRSELEWGSQRHRHLGSPDLCVSLNIIMLWGSSTLQPPTTSVRDPKIYIYTCF